VARRSILWAAVWGLVFGLSVISQVEGIAKAYPSLSARQALAQSVQSYTFIAGVPHHLETIAGYTVWKALTTAVIIGAIWGLRTSTGLLRGEEDAGRWELLLAGPTTRRRATIETLAGMGVALLGMFAVCAVLTLVAGDLPGARFGLGGSLYFAAAQVSGALMFLAIGALASQLSATGGQAAMLSAGALGASYLLRMLADSSSAMGWLRWWTPLGWTEELRPLEGPQPLAWVPIVGLTAMCCVASVVLAGRRDLNDSILKEREGKLEHPRWRLGSLSLAIRLSRTSALSWLAIIAVYDLVLGSGARAAANLFTDSPAVIAALGRLGVQRAADAYLGVVFFMAMILIAVIGASQITGIRDEEATSRLDNLLVRPVTRWSWLAGRWLVAVSLLGLAGVTAGVSVWYGEQLHRVGVDLGSLVQAGSNAAVPGVFVLGAGVLAFGVRPRASPVVAYGIVAWSTLVDLLGAFIRGADWLKDSSLFTHIALAPAAKPDWGADAIMLGLGLAAAVAGGLLFQRRDLQTE
jgi:ABC-2 type transport system permease protein